MTPNRNDFRIEDFERLMIACAYSTPRDLDGNYYEKRTAMHWHTWWKALSLPPLPKDEKS